MMVVFLSSGENCEIYRGEESEEAANQFNF